MTQYNADAIEVLTGLEPVRKRPGMYTDTTRPNHLAQEVIDNSVDEALAGHATAIEVELHADGRVTVQDDGRGIPCDLHEKTGRPALETVLTNDVVHKAMVDATPLKRLGEPEDIAIGALYLASPASAFVTGAVMDIHGGITSANLDLDLAGI